MFQGIGNALLQLSALHPKWENPPHESSSELNPKFTLPQEMLLQCFHRQSQGTWVPRNNSVQWQGTKLGVPKAQKAK